MPTVEIKYRRGHYLARIDGPDPKYGLRRDFEKGTPVKGRGVLAFTVRPGWYENGQGYGQPRRYLAVTELTANELPAIAVGLMDKISEGPLPDEPGCWNGDYCRCGATVGHYDEDGWPYCDTCGSPA